MKGETVYINGTSVSNVLVHVGGEYGQGAYEENEVAYPIGQIADYTLYFPRDYSGDLTGKTITVRGYECEVLGHPDHERPDQVFGRWLGSWDMTVHARKILSEFSEEVTVILRTITRDELGNRTTSDETLYTGTAQARKATGNETDAGTGTTSDETWFFVLPYLEAYKKSNTQKLFVEYDGREYDVISIEDINWKHNTASIKAVWHG